MGCEVTANVALDFGWNKRISLAQKIKLRYIAIFEAEDQSCNVWKKTFAEGRASF